jgi:phage/plasmid-associated DNA primase
MESLGELPEFIYFTCESLRAKMKSDGTLGKIPFGMPTWTRTDDKGNKLLFSKDHYKSLIKKGHKVNCILTGKMNDITVFDFDKPEEYDKFINDYPDFKDAFTIKTPKGFHVYSKYNEYYKTTTETDLGIDIRNDGGLVFGVGTESHNGEKYRHECGTRLDMEIPIDFYYYVSPKSKPKGKHVILKKEKKDYPVYNDVRKEADKFIEQFAECINISHIDNYESWRDIVWALASAQYYDLALRISKRSNKFQEEEFNKIYNAYRRTNCIKMGTFYHYCREGNPDKFAKLTIIKMNNENKDESDLFEDKNSQIDKAEYIFKLHGDNFVYDKRSKSGVLYIWDDSVSRWFHDDGERTKYYIATKLKEAGLKRLDEIRENMDMIKDADRYKAINELVHVKNKKMSEIRAVYEAFINELANRKDNIDFDYNPYLFAFNNCVYNFETKEFRKQRKEDYLLMNAGYDWEEPTHDEVGCISEIIDKIHVDPEVRRCYMSILYNGCIGVCPEKVIFANGAGRNGKGLLNDLFRKTIGDYGYEGAISILCDKLKGGANVELANFHKKRFVTFAEPNLETPINTATLKKISGGGEINARGLYSSETKCKLDAIIVIELNEMIKLNGTDADSEALKDRIRDVGFFSRFTAETDDDVNEEEMIFKKEIKYKKEAFQDQHKCALFHYITTYKDVEDIYTPECVAERSNKYLLGNDVIYTFVKNATDKTGDKTDVVQIKELYALFKLHDLYVNMEKAEKRRFNESYFRESIMKHSQFRKHYSERFKIQSKELLMKYDGVKEMRNVITGFALKPDEDEIFDNENEE